VNSPTKVPETIQYGFKQVSPSNLLKHDTHLAYPTRLHGEKWVRACLKPQLKSYVPEEIAFLFEVARGSMVYGIFFLPLASLASEQCYRVLEAGARRRWVDLGLVQAKRVTAKTLQDKSISQIISALAKAGKIPKADLEFWITMPFLRNRFSHPTSQTILPLQSALTMVGFTAGLLNRLFRGV
jgi:hypothetical protein